MRIRKNGIEREYISGKNEIMPTASYWARRKVGIYLMIALVGTIILCIEGKTEIASYYGVASMGMAFIGYIYYIIRYYGKISKDIQPFVSVR